MSLDYSQAESLKQTIVRHSRAGDLSLYSEAQERDLTLSELLEELDPTPRSANGNPAGQFDAFERQMLVMGLNGSGRRSITVEDFYLGGGLILLPEYIQREIQRGYRLVQDPQELLAASVAVNVPSVKPIYIKMDGAKESFAKRSDGAAYPTVQLLYREKEADIVDKGRSFDFSYKVIRGQRLDEFKVFLWWIGAQLAYDEIDDIYDVIINGDGTSPGAADVFNGAGGTWAYSDMVHLAMSFDVPSQMTHVLGTRDDIETILNLTQYQDPDTWHAAELFSKQGRYQGLLPMNAKLVVAPNATATEFAALDSRFAIRESVAQPLMIEAEKVISQKLETAVISKESVYTIMVDDAMKSSDY
ncbi:hypothetical protein CEE37_05070 [candidate division LCP-89 bacterium B3_LCP]|uniref:Uncharacterized protein n=1 Tax=candidate division LCP-89 bacterium B3_LCP TaxID=2012998 RepID=A0A532V1M1_UNCL8|nr:MAG: hypothetical protein CEE37_05070 [candidate division LCP-89 bacterium B3_LCP]